MSIGKKYIPPKAHVRGLLTNEKTKSMPMAKAGNTPKPGFGVNEKFANKRNAGKLAGAGTTTEVKNMTKQPKGANQL